MSTSSSAEDRRWAAGWCAGQAVLVTGGTGGIGGAIARAFRDAGAQVTVTAATDTEVAATLADDLFAGIAVRATDIRDGAAVQALIDGFDRLDTVVNCAGVIRRGAEHDPSVFASVVDINLTGTMRICTAALPLLAHSGGSVINIASMLSFFGGGLVPGYAASKGGIAQLTKSLAIAWAPQGVRVNAIAPGWIATPLTAALRADPARNDPILSRTPMRRWGEPHEIGGLALFLAGPQAGFMTGTVIPVDGGYAIS